MPAKAGDGALEGRGACWRGWGQRHMALRAIEKAPVLVDECRGDTASDQRNKALRFPSGATGHRVCIESEQ